MYDICCGVLCEVVSGIFVAKSPSRQPAMEEINATRTSLDTDTYQICGRIEAARCATQPCGRTSMHKELLQAFAWELRLFLPGFRAPHKLPLSIEVRPLRWVSTPPQLSFLFPSIRVRFGKTRVAFFSSIAGLQPNYPQTAKGKRHVLVSAFGCESSCMIRFC